MERSENPFIPRDPCHPYKNDFLIMNRVGEICSGGGRERKKKKRGRGNLSLKESIINTLVEIRGKRMAAQGFGLSGRNRKWMGAGKCPEIRMSLCVSARRLSVWFGVGGGGAAALRVGTGGRRKEMRIDGH